MPPIMASTIAQALMDLIYGAGPKTDCLELSQSGALRELREMSRLSYELDPSVPTEWMIKRVQFFAYELEASIDDSFTEHRKLSALNVFFFQKKKFQVVADPMLGSEPWSSFVLSHVLTARAGSPTVIALLYSILAKHLSIPLELVDLKPASYLRWVDSGRARYIDITRGGAACSTDELLEVLHARFQSDSLISANLLESYSPETYLVEYVLELRASLRLYGDPEKLLYLQNFLISLQPNNFNLLGERAVLHRQIGNFKSALLDLKRYFSFFERERAPEDLVELHDDLVEMLERPLDV